MLIPSGLDTEATSYCRRPRGLNDQPPGAVIVGAPRKRISGPGVGCAAAGGWAGGWGWAVVMVAS